MMTANAAHAQNDFNMARSKARTSRLFSFLSGKRDDLLPFEETKKLVRPSNESYAGLQTVQIERVVGSEGRERDFNIKFLPRRAFLRGRWERISTAHHEEKSLPPVNLYELGGVYFVRDGNHRVSVARTRGQAFIDAEVVRLGTAISLQPGMGLDDVRKAVGGSLNN